MTRFIIKTLNYTIFLLKSLLILPIRNPYFQNLPLTLQPTSSLSLSLYLSISLSLSSFLKQLNQLNSIVHVPRPTIPMNLIIFTPIPNSLSLPYVSLKFN